MVDLLRDIGTIDSTRFENVDEAVANELFVRIESAEEEFGIVRLTTHERDWNGILDTRPEFEEDSIHELLGGTTGVSVDRISQTNTDALEVSSISVANVRSDGGVKGEWANRDITYGLEGRRVTIWYAWWATQKERHHGLAIEGSFIVFQGKVGARDHEIRSNLALIPFGAIWNTRTGSLESSSVCRFAAAGLYGNTGEAAETCQVDMGNVLGTIADFPTCGGTRGQCVERSNEIHFGAQPLMLKPNTQLIVGVQRFTI